MHELQLNRMETSGLCNIRNLAIRDDGPVQSHVNGRGRYRENKLCRKQFGILRGPFKLN